MVNLADEEQFLKVGIVEDGDVVTIVDEGEMKRKDETGFKDDVFQCTVELKNKKKKIWTMNKTTMRKLGAAWGFDTVNWPGKKVKISIAKQMVGKELKDVLYGEPTK